MTGQSCHINASGSNQFRSDLSNTTTSNNTNTSSSLWDSENSQIIRDQDEFPYGRILDVANLRVFTFAEMKAATKNFSSNTVLGQGGFGTVYKGYIKDKTTTNRGHGLTIAVKKLNPKSSQGLKEWQVFASIHYFYWHSIQHSAFKVFFHYVNVRSDI